MRQAHRRIGGGAPNPNGKPLATGRCGALFGAMPRRPRRAESNGSELARGRGSATVAPSFLGRSAGDLAPGCAAGMAVPCLLWRRALPDIWSRRRCRNGSRGRPEGTPRPRHSRRCASPVARRRWSVGLIERGRDATAGGADIVKVHPGTRGAHLADGSGRACCQAAWSAPARVP